MIFVFCERTDIATPHARRSNTKIHEVKYKIYHTLPPWGLNTAVSVTNLKNRHREEPWKLEIFRALLGKITTVKYRGIFRGNW